MMNMFFSFCQEILLWIKSMEKCISGERLRIIKIEILIEVVSGTIQNINHLQIEAAPI